MWHLAVDFVVVRYIHYTTNSYIPYIIINSKSDDDGDVMVTMVMTMMMTTMKMKMIMMMMMNIMKYIISALAENRT